MAMIEGLEPRTNPSGGPVPVNFEPGLGHVSVSARETLVVTGDQLDAQSVRVASGTSDGLAGSIVTNTREIPGSRAILVRVWERSYGLRAFQFAYDVAPSTLAQTIEDSLEPGEFVLVQELATGANVVVPAKAVRRVNLTTGPGADRIRVERVPRPMRLDSGAGADRVDVYTDRATVVSGNGADRVSVFAKRATILGGKGDDRIILFGEAAVTGGAGTDELTLRAGSSILGEPAEVESVQSV